MFQICAGGSRVGSALLVGVLVCALGTGVQAASVTEIYGFTQPDSGFRPVPSALTAGPDGRLYGFTASSLSESGTYLPGGLFDLVPPADGHGLWKAHLLLLTPKYQSFELPLGGPLLLDEAGNLFGETTNDGPALSGTIFEMIRPATAADHWKFQTILNFRGGGDGAYPSGGLTEGPDGVLYGTAAMGGENENGVAFSLTPPVSAGAPWTETVLWRFGSGADGSVPYCAPVLGASGELYGTTGYGGAHALGAVFMLTPPATGESKWHERLLHDFTGAADGGNPYASLVRDAAGTLFGIASSGGPKSYGTAFALTPPVNGRPWKFKMLHAFSGKPDADSPEQPLILQPDGSLLGISMFGGNYADSFDGVGAIFKLTPPPAGKTEWTEKVVYNFGDGLPTVGELPPNALTESGGAFFGATVEGGPYGDGAAFKFVP